MRVAVLGDELRVGGVGGCGLVWSCSLLVSGACSVELAVEFS
jgi:hypothetical protein